MGLPSLNPWGFVRDPFACNVKPDLFFLSLLFSVARMVSRVSSVKGMRIIFYYLIKGPRDQIIIIIDKSINLKVKLLFQ